MRAAFILFALMLLSCGGCGGCVYLVGLTNHQPRLTLTADQLRAGHAGYMGRHVFLTGVVEDGPQRFNPRPGVIVYGVKVSGVWCTFSDRPADVRIGDQVSFIGEVSSNQYGQPALVMCN